MLAPLPGPSLPPRVEGDLIGTLAIHLQECSVDAFARIQFWGEQTFSVLHLHTATPDGPPGFESGRSAVVEYPLVGSVLALQKYLKDASPLQVQFLRRSEARHPGAGGEGLQPELVGCASIADICIAPLLRPEHSDTPNTCKFSLQRRLQILRPNTKAADGPQGCIGEASIGLHFRLVPTTAPASRMQSDSVKQGTANHRLGPQTGITGLQINNPGRLHTSMPNPPCINGIPANPSVDGDSTGLHSGLDANDSGDQQNLLDELLDLCADDMTMPTLDSADQSCFGTEMWISRIVAHASSPPAKEFPSLEAAGSRRSGDLRQTGVLKLEVEALALLARFANRLNGPNDFFVKYRPPPHTFETSDAVEVTVCEQFGTQSKRARAGGQPRALKAKDRLERVDDGNDREISLLSDAHSKEMPVEFKDDEAVREWLDGTLELSLLCRASKPAEDPNLPRVARLAGKTKASTTAKSTAKVCLGRATLRLRDVLLSDTFTSSAKLDLMSSKDGSELLVGSALKPGTKIGSISVRLGLHDRRNNRSTSRGSPTTPTEAAARADDGRTQILMRGLQSASASTPHPISVFLSNYAGASNDAGIGTLANRDNNQLSGTFPGSPSNEQLPKLPAQHTTQKAADTTALKPVKAPPIWVDIRVDRLSDLCLDVGSRDSGCIQLCMSCSHSILSLDSLAHLQAGERLDKSVSAGYQIRSDESVKLRSGHGGPVSSRTACSWQVALEAGDEGRIEATITIHLWHCTSVAAPDDAAERTLLGLVEVPVAFDPACNLHQELCDWLPLLAANDWFDVVHPRSTRMIGKVRMVIAAGMLRQIRGFSAICKRVSIIQRWWRRARPSGGAKEGIKPEEGKEAESEAPVISCEERNYLSETKLDCQERERARDSDPEFDTIHARFAEQSGGVSSKGRRDDPSSSPDSLFEEWSQQSLPVTRIEFSHRRQSKGAKQPKPVVAASGEAFSSSSIEDGNAESPDLFGPANNLEKVAIPEKEAKGIERRPSDQTEGASVGNADILVRLESLSGLQHILSSFLLNKHASLDKDALLSVSGIFVSLSIGHNDAAPLSEEEELRRLCYDTNVWHSNLMPTESIALDADVELKLEATMSMPNHEATKMILSQVLEIRIWFVPLITSTIEAMMTGSKAKDPKALDGCAVMSIAQCPLYPLYTPRGRYGGRAPCMSVDESKTSVGSVSVKVCLDGASARPLASSLAADDENIQSTAHDAGARFSQGQEERLRPDPPEEVTQCRYKGPRKRKLEGGSASPLDNAAMDQNRFKRHRVTALGDDQNPLVADSSKALEEESHQAEEDETETLCPSDGSFDCDQSPPENDVDDDSMTYRSLTSVMASLVNVDATLRRADPIDETRAKSASPLDAEPNCHASRSNHDIITSPMKHDLPRQKSEPEACMGHQMEPPEERSNPQTPTTKKSAVGTTNTCEKASSPVSLSHCYAEAGTSPAGESLAANQAAEETANQNQGHSDDRGGEEDECEHDDANPIRRGALGTSSSERLQHRLDLSHTGLRSQESPFRYNMPSRRFGSSRGIFRGSSILRSNRLLSPPLDSLSPTRGAALAGSDPRDTTENDERTASAKRQSLERLERIFCNR